MPFRQGQTLMKRLLCILICVLCALSLCAIGVFVLASGETIYVSGSGNDSNSGESASAPKATLVAAINAIGNSNGTIVVCDDITLSGADGKLPSHSGKITITSKQGMTDYSSTITVQNDINLGGNTVIEHVTLHFSSAKNIYCNGNNAVFGNGITVSYDGATAPSIYGGKDSSASGATASSLALGSFTLQVDSGTWNKVYCGNYRNPATNPLGALSGNTKLTINGGRFFGGVSAAGQENRVGNAELVINGGEFLCSVYAIPEPCYDYGKQLTFTGDIDITIGGGMFAGDIAIALRDEEAAFSGNCNINLNAGDFSRVNRIKGAEQTALYASGMCTAYLNIANGIDIDSEQTSTDIAFSSGFSDSLSTSSVYYHDGWYYYTYSSSYKTRTALWIKRAANFSDLQNARPQLVWSNALTPTDITGLYAPQLTFLEDSFYIYTACTYTSNSEIRKPVVFTAKTADNPLEGFIYNGPMQGLDENVYSYMTFAFTEMQGKSFMITSGFYRAEDRVAGSKHYQSLFITEMASPTSLSGTASKIAESTYSWEMSNSNKCRILEKPFVYIAKDGTLYIFYSSSEAGRVDYCTGYLRYDGTTADGMKNASLWSKSPEPVHLRDTSSGIYAPGGIVLLPSPDGDSTWLVYTARTTSTAYTTSGRTIYAQPFLVNDSGAPIASTTLPKSTAMSFKSSTMPISERIEGFNNNLIYISSTGNDSNKGSTPTAPKATLYAAVKALSTTGGKIVICDDMSLSIDQCTLQSYSKNITISSTHGAVKYNAKITVLGDIYLGGKTTFEYISLYYPSAMSIYCGGYDTVFGDGMDISYDGFTPPSVYGGKNSSASGATTSSLALQSFNLRIDSGIWDKVYCGNYRPDTANPIGRLTGDTTLTINGGTFKGAVSASGSENRTGNASLIINGGKFMCSIYGIAEPCEDVGKRISLTGDISIVVNGGTLTGDISVACRESESTFTGHCDIKLLSGDFSRLNLIKGAEDTVLYNRGKCTAYLHLGENVDINAELTGIVKFTNHIADFADPSVFYHNGWYYYTYSKSYKGKPALWIRRAANFSDISSARPQLVWAEATASAGMTSLWAPQLTFLEGRLYIYATCAFESVDATLAKRRPVVFTSIDANDPRGGFTYYGPMDNIDPEVYSYLSPRFIQWQGKTYMINGGFFRKEDRVEGEKHIQSLFVTELASPTAFAGKAYKIAGATYNWEISNAGKVEILEGPFAYTGASDGKLYVIYSANETATDNYCTGLLRFDGTSSDSITDASLWYKFPEPIHKKDATLGIYSPGASVIVPSPNGEQLWMIYHAKLTGGVYTYDGRILFAQPFATNANGVPINSSPIAIDTVLSYETNSMPLSERIEGFDRLIDLSIPPEVGDIDCDRQITNSDMTLLIRYLSGFTSDVSDITLCDFDGNGKINNRDAIGLINKISSAS